MNKRGIIALRTFARQVPGLALAVFFACVAVGILLAAALDLARQPNVRAC